MRRVGDEKGYRTAELRSRSTHLVDRAEQHEVNGRLAVDFALEDLQDGDLEAEVTFEGQEASQVTMHRLAPSEPGRFSLRGIHGIPDALPGTEIGPKFLLRWEKPASRRK